MGANQSDLLRLLEEQQQQQQQQQPQQHQQPRPQPQQQQQPQPQQHQQHQKPQSQLQQQQPQPHQKPQPQPQQHQHHQQHQQHQQPQPQPPKAQPPQPHEPTNKVGRLPSRKEAWLLSPEHGAEPSNRSTKAVQNATVVKANETDQSKTQAKPMIKELNFPHNYEHILKDADSPVDKSSREKLFDQLYAGVFLDHKTKKYWVEKKSNANCFMLYAKALSITWAEDQNYWKWIQQKDASGTITLAELKRVCWLEVHGKFDTRKLSPGVLYQVSYVIMLKDPAQGWEVPVNVRLVLPGGKKQQHQEKLMDKLRGRWIEIPVGEFVTSEKHVGEMEISMYEYEGGMWKQGLVIKGVAIKPKD